VASQVFYNSPSSATSVTPASFLNFNGDAADPASITAVLIDPTGVITNYTWTGGSGVGAITKVSTGNYTLTVDGLNTAGLYTYTWVGTGNNVQQVTPGTFRLVSLSDVGTGLQYWYCGLEELKSRMGWNLSDKTYHSYDYEAQAAIQAVTNWIDDYCGRHFWQIHETRTYAPLEGVWELGIDDLVSTPSVVSATQVNLDYDGDGVYEVPWTLNSNYQLKLGSPGNWNDNYNINSGGGVPRPYRQLQVLTSQPGAIATGGGYLPFVWPYTNMNRVEITGTWGWNTIPPNVSQAALILATDLFKMKDAPWGITGGAEGGAMKVSANPIVVELLRKYINVKRKVGI